MSTGNVSYWKQIFVNALRIVAYVQLLRYYVHMEMGERIKQLRLQLGMTLEEVGDIVGVSKSTVLKWENGNIANMRRDKIALLAKALHTSPAYLMGWVDEPDQTFSDDVPDPDDDTLRLAEELRTRPGMRMLFDATKNCTEEDMKRVAAMIKAFKGEDD